jgi:hypothetical protein
LAMEELDRAKHGQREAILSRVGNGINLNTVRREIKALAFLDVLEETDPELCLRLQDSSFNAIEALARWYDFDRTGAVEAATKLASGEYSLGSVQSAMRDARSKRRVPSRKDLLARIEPSIKRQIRQLLGGTSVAAESPSAKSNSPPLDFIFRLTRANGCPESVAAMIVGPYRNAAVYSKRRHDELLRAMGMAWMFDHVVVLLPAACSWAEYQRWLAEYVSAISKYGAKQANSAQVRRPSVHVIGVKEL